MADPRLKTLKIKSGIVKRITKEKIMYIKEAEKQVEKVQQMKDKGAGGEDEYHIRKQEEVLQEARMMVPECHRRLVKSYEDLKNILDSELELAETGEYLAAKEILDAAYIQIEASKE